MACGRPGVKVKGVDAYQVLRVGTERVDSISVVTTTATH